MPVIVVLGATGIVGSGVIKHYLKDGRNMTIVAPVRGDAQKLFDMIGSEYSNHPSLHVVKADYGGKEGMEHVAKWVTDNISGSDGKVDHVFVVSGGMAPNAAVSQMTPELFHEMALLKVFPVLYAAQFLIPLLKNDPSCSFTVVTGGLGEICLAPPLALTTLANTNEIGIVLGIQSEQKLKKFRVNELRICAFIVKDGEHSNHHVPGITGGANTSVLASVFHERVISNHDTRDSVVRISTTDLGL
jgi:NAD(P)-dependent dehydrogenase (short-subunit alcohol dehydrogenase family)